MASVIDQSPGPIPDRPADHEYVFSLHMEPPGPEQFVKILEAHGFVFDRTTCPIQLRWPKEAVMDEGKGTVTYRQWDEPA